MISGDLNALATHFFSFRDDTVQLEPAASLAIARALDALATQVEMMEKAIVPPLGRPSAPAVPRDFSHLVCKAPPWGWSGSPGPRRGPAEVVAIKEVTES